MIKNYLKIAFRSFWNQKLTSSINLIGLSFGIACASAAFVFIKHELSFDRFHEESEHIAWMTTTVNNFINLSTTPGVLAPTLKEDYPEVTEYLRLEVADIYVQSGKELHKERAHFVDPNFFSFFNFDLQTGNEATALTAVNSIVLNEKMARQYYGRTNPVGENFSIYFNNEQHLLKVTGVAKQAPSNSSIQFDYLLPVQFSHQENQEALNSDWKEFPSSTFLRLRQAADLERLKEKLPALAKSKYDDAPYTFDIHAFADYHFENSKSLNGLSAPSDKQYVKLLGIIALLILLVACLNFMNLSNAQGSHRLREVGVRQVLGAGRRQLIAQFMISSVLISLLSLGFAIILLEAFLPYTTSLFEYPLQLEWQQPGIFFSLLGIATVTGLLAGSYPSFLLSRLKAVNTFKSDFKIGGNNWITKGSLVLQFALSIGLLICTTVMFQQQQFISQRNLGFNQEEIVVIPTHINYDDKIDSKGLVARYRSEINKLRGVVNVSGVSNSFTRGNRAQFIEGEDGAQELIFDYRIEPQYLDMLNIELVAGRNFSDEIQEDREQSIIVNEAFLKKYEISDYNGYVLPNTFGKQMTGKKIIGVTKDYHFEHLRREVKPLFLHMNERGHFEHILVKIKPEDIQSTIAGLNTAWQTVRSEKPFEVYFLDEDLQKQYEAETKWSKVLTGATSLAILIAFLGLFGLVALVLTQRTREIGIRKVLGASVGNIVTLFAKNFILLVIVGLVIASPIAYYFMEQWLQDFAFRIDIQWWVFALAGLAIVVVAVMAVSLQSIRAALANPVDSLRSE